MDFDCKVLKNNALSTHTMICNKYLYQKICCLIRDRSLINNI